LHRSEGGRDRFPLALASSLSFVGVRSAKATSAPRRGAASSSPW
jgi:hypothetical protein